MSDHNRFIARIVTRLNPEAWDAIVPHGPAWTAVAGPFPQPWRTPISQLWDRLSAVGLNPQPLPPKEQFAVAVTNAMLSQVVALANAAAVGGDSERGQRQAFKLLQEWDELCPRWPRWPKTWPPPPDPPDWFDDEMPAVAHFLAATRVLAAADAVYEESVAQSLVEIGNRQFEQALSRMGSDSRTQ